jgi:hypothetical protein
MKGDAERCLQAGMDAHVSKPIQVDELMQVMHRLVPPLPVAGRAGDAAGIALSPTAETGGADLAGCSCVPGGGHTACGR